MTGDRKWEQFVTWVFVGWIWLSFPVGCSLGLVANRLADHRTETVADVSSPRRGAICWDGWVSSSTGRGTCSHHGGVREWLHTRQREVEVVVHSRSTEFFAEAGDWVIKLAGFTWLLLWLSAAFSGRRR